jgi:hypothetical protein
MSRKPEAMNAARPAAGKTKLDQFVREFGVEELARRLGVHSSAIWHWIDGTTSPHPSNAIKVQTLAKERGVELTLEEVYQHSREVGSKRYRPRALKPKLAREARSTITTSPNR